MFQKRYSDDFCFELEKKLLDGSTIKAYFNKHQFKPAVSFDEFSEDLSFKSFPEDAVVQMLKHISDFERGKVLFENLTHLSRREAADIGFWNYLSHNQLYKVVHRMWPDIENPPNKSSSESYIRNHWIMTSSAQSSLMDYPLSGLWWSFFLTIDENRADKYELTRIFFKNLTFRTKLFGQSKIARHKEAVIGVLEFIKEHNLDLQNFEENGSAIVPYLNLLGGLKPLGAFDRVWFKDRLKSKFLKDIEDYGRLFRRDERKDSLLKKSSENQILTKDEIVEVFPKSSISKKVICVLGDNLIITETETPNLDFQVEIDINENAKSLFVVYKNGFVKKFDVNVLRELKLFKRYSFEVFPSKIINVFFTESDSLLLTCFKNSIGKKSLKVFPGKSIDGNGFEGKGTRINSLNNELNVLPIPNTFKDKIPSLIKSYSEAAFAYDSTFLKNEIDSIKMIIEENGML